MFDYYVQDVVETVSIRHAPDAISPVVVDSSQGVAYRYPNHFVDEYGNCIPASQCPPSKHFKFL